MGLRWDDARLPLTGERTVPGIPHENYWFRRHEVVYRTVAPRCAARAVLDAGCGEGYGADLLADVAGRVIALDIDAPTVAHAARAYPRLGAVRADVRALPLAASSVDTVISLQVVEHVWEQVPFLAECARVLRPGGELLVSTPNRLTFSAGSHTPLNPFHTVEASPDELADLLGCAGLRVESMLGLRHGPALRELDGRHGGSLVDTQVALAVEDREWPVGLLADVAAVRCADFEITDRDVASSLDLVALARR
jgi:SAM-dependent methyltransferase